VTPKADPKADPRAEKKKSPPRRPDSTPERQEEGGVAVQEAEPKLKEPKHYAVMLHNDDYTSMEFVTEVLLKFFHKTSDEAVQIMLKVHHQGKGVAGIYTYQIAETKVAQVQTHAREKGFPLKCTVEEL
jgi:ATP-dependent Clp protease adaptor protein ClpS